MRMYVSQARSDAVVRLKLIEEQEGKLLSSLDPTRAARDARTVNNTRTASVAAGTAAVGAAVEKRAADAATVPASVGVEGTSAVAAAVAVDGDAVGADGNGKVAEAAEGAVSAEEGAPASVMDVDGGDGAGEGEKQIVADIGAEGVQAAAIEAVQGGQGETSVFESERTSQKSAGAGSAKEGSKEVKREMTEEQVKMDERDAREWRRCFISACRWFDIDQVLCAFDVWSIGNLFH
jgi:hypothetical protein